MTKGELLAKQAAELRQELQALATEVSALRAELREAIQHLKIDNGLL